MRSMQGMQARPTTSGNAIVDGHGGFAQNSAETAMRRDDSEREPIIASAGRFGTMPHSKNRLVETTNTLVDMCLTKIFVKITNPSLVNYKCLINHIG